MSPRVVLVAGAGSLRATPPTLAALAAFAPDHEVELRLWEPDPERLDLFDRFLRACLAITKLGHQTACFDRPVEAFDGVEAVIFTLNENGARRFLSPPDDAPEEEEAPEKEKVKEREDEARKAAAAAAAASEAEAEDPHSVLMEFGYGDRNHPTPRSRLSRNIRAMIHRPDLSVDRESALRMALERLELLAPAKAHRLYLVRQVHFAPEHGAVMEWPKPMSEDEIRARPHEILRHIQGGLELDLLIDEARRSPVTRWLTSL